MIMMVLRANLSHLNTDDLNGAFVNALADNRHLQIHGALSVWGAYATTDTDASTMCSRFL